MSGDDGGVQCGAAPNIVTSNTTIDSTNTRTLSSRDVTDVATEVIKLLKHQGMFPLTGAYSVQSDQSSTSVTSSESTRQSNAITDQVAANITLDTVNPSILLSSTSTEVVQSFCGHFLDNLKIIAT